MDDKQLMKLSKMPLFVVVLFWLLMQQTAKTTMTAKELDDMRFFLGVLYCTLPDPKTKVERVLTRILFDWISQEKKNLVILQQAKVSLIGVLKN